MKARPILFSTPMVQAILEGRKTQTRRVVKPQPGDHPDDDGHVLYRCPYGQVGDVLWVKETYAYARYDFDHIADQFIYKSDYSDHFVYWKWKPSLFMPKSAARIFLKITNVRVKRLHHISSTDIKSEGAHYTIDYYDSLLDAWQSLWQSINGEQSWNGNPYVWVIEFERIDKPENF
jgi:hypothetical protein